MRSMLTCLLLLAFAGTALAEPVNNTSLNGRVEKAHGTRIQRPLNGSLKSGVNGLAPQHPLPASASMSTAQPQTAKSADESFSLPAHADDNSLLTGVEHPRLEPAAPAAKAIDVEINSTQPAKLNAATSTDVGTSEVRYRKDGTTWRDHAGRKLIVVRLKRLVGGPGEVEVVEEAVGMADSMLRKKTNPNVIVVLDMESVHIADKKFEFADTQSTDERGETRIVSLKDIRAMLTAFMDNGGKVVAHDHWTKVFGITNKDNLVPGVSLISKGDLAQLLIDAQSIIEY